MNMQQLLPIISQVVGRDVSGEVNLFVRSREALGRALNPEGQRFVLGHWRQLPDFMESQAGRDAMIAFINAWIVGTYPQLAPPPQTTVPQLQVPELPAIAPEPPSALLS